MADTERLGSGTKRISSGPETGMEAPHSRKPESVDIIQDNRRAGNAERIPNSQTAGNAQSGRGGRPGNAQAGGDSRNAKRHGNARSGKPADAGNAKHSQGGRREGPGRAAPKGNAKGHARAGNAQAAGQPVMEKRGKKPKGKKSGWKFLAGFLCAAVVLAGLGYLVVVLFEVERIVVAGNQYCSEEEIIEWLTQDPYSDNSLYLLWKYNQNDVERLPAVEEAKVGLKDLRTVYVQVKEKTFSGRIDYAGKSLYFDQQGKAALVTDALIEGVPYIEGMEVSEDDVILGEPLPREEGQVYEEIRELIPLLEKQGLSPDKISSEGTDLTLHFGGVRVQVGNGKFADRLAQVPPILEKLAEMYAGQTGVLHLENYDVTGSSIRFVPDTAQTPPGAEPQAAGPAAQPEGEGEGEAAAEGP